MRFSRIRLELSSIDDSLDLGEGPLDVNSVELPIVIRNADERRPESSGSRGQVKRSNNGCIGGRNPNDAISRAGVESDHTLYIRYLELNLEVDRGMDDIRVRPRIRHGAVLS